VARIGPFPLHSHHRNFWSCRRLRPPSTSPGIS
jgi:hypothetical protein